MANLSPLFFRVKAKKRFERESLLLLLLLLVVVSFGVLPFLGELIIGLLTKRFIFVLCLFLASNNPCPDTSSAGEDRAD